MNCLHSKQCSGTTFTFWISECNDSFTPISRIYHNRENSKQLWFLIDFPMAHFPIFVKKINSEWGRDHKSSLTWFRFYSFFIKFACQTNLPFCFLQCNPSFILFEWEAKLAWQNWLPFVHYWLNCVGDSCTTRGECWHHGGVVTETHWAWWVTSVLDSTTQLLIRCSVDRLVGRQADG